jgi:hypothetical protein
LGGNGQIDPISALGIRSGACDRPSEIEDPNVRQACAQSGAPEGRYPASNYGFDVHIDTGIDAPTGTFAKGLVLILNGIWLGLLFILKLVFAVLGLAFGLNPFSDGRTMSQITSGIAQFYSRITDPWLTTLVVAGGVWMLWRGLVQRQLGSSVAGTIGAVALLLVGLWIVHYPRQTVGEAAGMADDVAVGVIGAPESGSADRPTGSYAEALAGSWQRLSEVPFAALNFSDVAWAMGPPPKEAVQKANENLCADTGISALNKALSAGGKCSDAVAAARFGTPESIVDLYLRSSPGSPSRNALWDYFDNDVRYKAKVAAQGGDGVMTRLSLVAVFCAAILGAVLLLAWLAIRLFTQAAVAFVLVLAAPLVLFLPLLGDSGRRAFKTWGLTLLGAILAKVIYATFLAIVLLGIKVIGAPHSATGFLLVAAFTWAVFLKRTDLVGWINLDPQHRESGHLAAFALGSRLATGGARKLSGGGVSSGRWAAGRAADGATATRRAAGTALTERATALGDERYRQAQSTVSGFESGIHADRSGYGSAKSLISRADHNERTTGKRWDAADLRRFGDEDRALLANSRSPVDHAHRAGLSRDQFERLHGPERQRAEAAIEKAIKRDKQRLAFAPDRAGRLIKAPTFAERARQMGEGQGQDRREHLRGLRRRRRAEPLALARRNLSRGA